MESKQIVLVYFTWLTILISQPQAYTKAYTWTTVCGPYVVTLLKWTPTFKWYTPRLVVKHRQSGLYAQNIDNTLCSIPVNTIERAYVIAMWTYIKRKGIFTLTSHTFCISTPILETWTDNLIANWMRDFPIQSNGPKLSVKLWVSTTGPHTLAWLSWQQD